MKLFRYANRIPLLYDECYSDDTKVLTRDGFKFFSDLTYDDDLATLNPSTGFLEYQKPTRIINYHHSGEMIHFAGGYLDLLVTPNHRMYASRANRGFEFLPASEILQNFTGRVLETEQKMGAHEAAKLLYSQGYNYSNIAVQLALHKSTVRGWLDGSHKELRYTKGMRPHFYLKRDAAWRGEWNADSFTLPPARAGRGSHHTERTRDIPMNLWLRFLGWYLAEGSAFRDKGGYVISLGFGDKDLRYKDEIDECLCSLGVRPRWIVTGEHSYEIRLSHKQLYEYLVKFGHAAEKYIPKDIKALPKERLEVILDALVKGDGTVTKHGSRVFGTVSSTRLAEDVAETALKCGYAVSLGRSEAGTCVYLNVKHKATKLKSVELRPYSGAVWCATVPNHLMFVERNGKTAWSGNSSDVSFKVLNEEVDWRRYHVPQDAPIAVITHICSTKIPYKTVGKEYIADRPEIERDIKNAAREALRRLGIFLSRKGSMEAVQRKMNIYGKYLPLIARFAMELAEKRRPPNYQKLVGEGEVESSRQEAPQEVVATGQLDREESPEAEGNEEIEVEQKKIDEYRGS
jgi:hypothetical protein